VYNLVKYCIKKQVMKTSGEGVALIRKFEGCEVQAYQCSASVWTLGYGHTRDVSEGDTCTKDEAEQILISDLQEFEGYVNDLVKIPLDQNQFDALVAWTFNLGPTNLKSSTLLVRLNDNNLDDVPHQLRRWNKAGGKVLDGLVRRREAEALLWLGEEWSHV
tara:strand:- start:68 stop:550 length:483 start_codon:yes stop_codon:yes gene_type:complete